MDCDEGEVLSPLAYCKCIPDSELYDMFCEPGATDESDSDDEAEQQ